jgi:hypothetical protein
VAAKKRRVNLDYDNVHDFFDPKELEPLLDGVTVGDDGIPQESPVVRRLLRFFWDASAADPDHEFYCTPFEAVLILEHLAGVRED